MNTVYKIRLASRRNSIVLFIILCALFFLAAKLFIPSGGLHNSILAITFAILFFIIAWLLWQVFVMGTTEWNITEMGISVKWTKKFLLPEKNFNLIWSEIKGISKSWGGGQYDILKIRLLTGSQQKFYHDIFSIRDDFKELVKVLYQSMSDRNARLQG